MSTSANNYLDNFGGINRIFPIEVSNIAVFSRVYQSTVGLLTVYQAITPLAVDIEQTTFEENQKDSNSGIYFDSKLISVIPKDKLELIKWANQNQYKEFIVVMIDNNGLIKVVGTPDEPLKLSVSSSPGKITTLNSYNIIFSRKMRSRAYFLNALPEVAVPS